MIDVYLEIGTKRTFAGGIEWPGWCRAGRDEKSALQALLDSGPRFARVINKSVPGFKTPTALAQLRVTERLRGNSTTDFGAPGMAPAIDAQAVDANTLHRYESLLGACWRYFDAVRKGADRKPLRTGPRGGGRELGAMVAHVLEADGAYLSGLGWKFMASKGESVEDQFKVTREAILSGFRASAKGEIPAKGPRGGQRWSARYFVRRVAWHVLDHAWEIEDRLATTNSPI